MTRWRSPRQRRDTARRRRWQRAAAELEARLAPLREELAATRPVTPVTRLADEFGVNVVTWRLRHGRGVSASWPGGRVVGDLEGVRAELEHRRDGKARVAAQLRM
jgi:hypothetical protein